MREREMALNVLTSGSPLTNPTPGPDCSVFIMKYSFFQFYIPRKIFSRSPGGMRIQVEAH
jgi:hypothetical protein